MSVVADVVANLRADPSDFESGFRRAGKAVDDFGSKIHESTGVVSGFRDVAGATALAVGASFADLGAHIASATMSFNSMLQGFSVQLQGFGESANQAQANLNNMAVFAEKMGLNVEQVEAASTALQQYGGSAINTKQSMQALANAAAATGTPINTLAGQLGSMYQMLSSGEAGTSRLVRMLVNMKVVTGEQAAQLNQLSQAGASSNQIWSQLMTDMAKFNGSAQNYANTFAGLRSSIHSLFTEDVATSFKPIFESVNNAALALKNFMSGSGWAHINSDFHSFATVIAHDIDDVTKHLKDLGTAFQSNGLSTFTHDLSQITTLLGVAAGASGSFATEFMTKIPILGQALKPLSEAFGPLHGGLLGLVMSSHEGRTALVQLGDAILSLLKDLTPLIGAVNAVLSAISPIVIGFIHFTTAIIDFIAHVKPLVDLIGGIVLALYGFNKLQEVTTWFGGLLLKMEAWATGAGASKAAADTVVTGAEAQTLAINALTAALDRLVVAQTAATVGAERLGMTSAASGAGGMGAYFGGRMAGTASTATEAETLSAAATGTTAMEGEMLVTKLGATGFLAGMAGKLGGVLGKGAGLLGSGAAGASSLLGGTSVILPAMLSYMLSSMANSYTASNNENIGTTQANMAIKGVSTDPLKKQIAILQAKYNQSNTAATVEKKDNGWDNLINGSSWLSAITFGAYGKSAEFNKNSAEAATYKGKLAELEAQLKATKAAQDSLNSSLSQLSSTGADSTMGLSQYNAAVNDLQLQQQQKNNAFAIQQAAYSVTQAQRSLTQANATQGAQRGAFTYAVRSPTALADPYAAMAPTLSVLTSSEKVLGSEWETQARSVNALNVQLSALNWTYSSMSTASDVLSSKLANLQIILSKPLPGQKEFNAAQEQNKLAQDTINQQILTLQGSGPMTPQLAIQIKALQDQLAALGRQANIQQYGFDQTIGAQQFGISQAQLQAPVPYSTQLAAAQSTETLTSKQNDLQTSMNNLKEVIDPLQLSYDRANQKLQNMTSALQGLVQADQSVISAQEQMLSAEKAQWDAAIQNEITQLNLVINLQKAQTTATDALVQSILGATTKIIGLFTNLDTNPSTIAANTKASKAGLTLAHPTSNSTLNSFLMAEKHQESGGNYNDVNQSSGAMGAYQIMPTNWSSWASAAGLGANAAFNAQDQDIVAASTISQLYKALDNNWTAVAIAWYAGGSAAQKYLKEGSSGAAKDPFFTGAQNGGPSILDYASKVVGYFEGLKQINQGVSPAGPARMFDSGGILPPGLTVAHNQTGQNEYVLTAAQLASVTASYPAGLTIQVTLPGGGIGEASSGGYTMGPIPQLPPAAAGFFNAIPTSAAAMAGLVNATNNATAAMASAGNSAYIMGTALAATTYTVNGTTSVTQAAGGILGPSADQNTSLTGLGNYLTAVNQQGTLNTDLTNLNALGLGAFGDQLSSAESQMSTFTQMENSLQSTIDTATAAISGQKEALDNLQNAYQLSQDALTSLQDQQAAYKSIADAPLQGTLAATEAQQAAQNQIYQIQQQISNLKLQGAFDQDPRIVALNYQLNYAQAQLQALQLQQSLTLGVQQQQLQDTMQAGTPEVAFGDALTAAQNYASLGGAVFQAQQQLNALKTQVDQATQSYDQNNSQIVMMNNELTALQSQSKPVSDALQLVEGAIGTLASAINSANTAGTSLVGTLGAIQAAGKAAAAAAAAGTAGPTGTTATTGSGSGSGGSSGGGGGSSSAPGMWGNGADFLMWMISVGKMSGAAAAAVQNILKTGSSADINAAANWDAGVLGIPVSFDNGGLLMPGMVGINMTGKPEPVLTPDQWGSLAGGGGRGGVHLYDGAVQVKLEVNGGLMGTDVAAYIEQRVSEGAAEALSEALSVVANG